jgi:hypothetical protein
VAREAQERRQRWEEEDRRTVEEAARGSEHEAQQRRQRWETEYQEAVQACYSRELQDTQQLCDQLEAEYRDAMEEAQARAAQHGEELREWHADDRISSPGINAVDALNRVDAPDPFDGDEAPSDEVAP